MHQMTGKRVVEIINTKLTYFFRSVLGVEKLSGSCAVMAVIEERRRVWQLLLISAILVGATTVFMFIGALYVTDEYSYVISSQLLISQSCTAYSFAGSHLMHCIHIHILTQGLFQVRECTVCCTCVWSPTH